MAAKKGRKALAIAGVLLLVIIAIPLIAAGISFIGRVSPDSVIPDSFDFYVSIPNPVRLVEQVLKHETLPEILALAELAPLVSQLNQINNTGLTENKLIQFAAKGRLDAAFLPGGNILAAWDAGILSPLLKILPSLAGRITIPGLYYVQAGKNSRFEFRLDDGNTLFIGPHKNLLVISNNSLFYESVIAGSSRQGDIIGSTVKSFYVKDQDIAFLFSPEALMGTLEEADPQLLSAINMLNFPGLIQMSLSILPNQLKIHLRAPIETSSPALQKMIERNSQGTPLLAMIPDSSQYMTMLAAGNLNELLDAVSTISAERGDNTWENTMRRADSSSRMALGLSLQELLFSWSGSQFALYGLEGRPNPVIAIQISDENKRNEVFNKAFRSIFVSENVQQVIDGNRIPRIEVPDFLTSLLRLMSIQLPSPYYTVQNNFLLISESVETLLAAVNAVRRNDVLPKNELWRTLSEDNQGPSSFALYYSLEQSIPFFLKGSGTVLSVLKSYHQGLAQIRLENQYLDISLNVISGSQRGLVPVNGFPIDLAAAASAQGRADKLLNKISSGKDTILLLTMGNDVILIDPLSQSIKKLNLSSSDGTQIFIASEEDNSRGAWIVDSRGHVDFVNRELESQRNFPFSSGIQLSGPPISHGGKLYLSAEDGSVHTVDSGASVRRWGTVFYSPLRSAPYFFDFGNKTYAAVYPKSFFGEIFILDETGSPLKAWPVSVPGIAFGSPLLFSANFPDAQEALFAAFITQAGELAVYSEIAEMLPGFPLELPGVFYLQPVFDGESLWVIESEGTLYRIELNGEYLSLNIPRLSVKEEGYIAAADIDGDKRIEIIFSGEGNALHAYSQNFSSLEGFPLPVWGKPVFGDLNGDGKNNIAGVGMDNKLYMWQWR